ncbi:adenine nucleotide alpha hydrolases-like protein [Polyplosphaeria fusca]|uniref:Adenine nucleotide alpha hydrolases-like protein n=1 Tax=Polyplosphaeria fusca TaxID=682080 RepID=A0A9P4QRG0_9PLEO|nr:adenine nucleotide alpha hydrolases-like protein [Polyplosphaeria fusca]
MSLTKASILSSIVVQMEEGNGSVTIAESQPFHDTESTVHAVVTGEFYDYKTVRDDLIQRGYTFQSLCDSEIVIALYKEYGVSFLSHLRGEFSGCLYDSKCQFFMAFKDRYGVKPLFYTIHDGRLLIASEMKAFLPFGWRAEWDVQSMLEQGWLGDSRTIFQGVQKVLPGHYLAVQSFGTITQHEYWDIEYKDKHKIDTRSQEELVEGVRDRLLDAVRVRLRADVPVGIFLSGGLDSSVVAGMIKHLIINEGATLGSDRTDRINCFSIKFMDEEYDEEPIARRTAEWLGVKEHVVEMDEEKFAEYFEDATWICEHTILDLNYIGKFALSKLTRETNVKVVLTGEGSDEHFAGYGDLLGDMVREPDYAWPKNDLPEEQRIKHFERIEYRDPNAVPSLKAFRTTDPESAKWPRKQINNVGFVSFLSFAGIDGQVADWSRQEFGVSDARTATVHTKWHPLHTALYIWSRFFMSNVLLTALGDRVEMAHSIEGRQPFLDHQLTEYINAIPPSLKLKWEASTQSFNEKWILKEAAKPFITDELYNRRKHPFTAPVRWKANGPLYKFFAKTVTRENVERVGFLAWGRCKNLLEEGIVMGDAQKVRKLYMVAQLVILSQRFKVKKSEPEYLVTEIQGHDNASNGSLTVY